MGEKLAFLIAVERGTDAALPPRPFAVADVTALAAALELLGYVRHNVTLLTGANAARDAIVVKLRRLARGLEADDEALVFYSGHGFAAWPATLTSADTRLPDVHGTGVPVEDLLGPLRASACRHVAVFVDAPAIDSSAESIPSAVWAGFASDQSRAVFTSCVPGQLSYASGMLKHSVWVHHLLEALTAAAPVRLARGHHLTAAVLQQYLLEEMPRTLRRVIAVPVEQTPGYFGRGNFRLADLGPVAAARTEAQDVRQQRLRRVAFRAERRVRVKDLPGFQKGHHIPDRITPSAAQFLAAITAHDLKADLDDVYAAVRQRWGYKRKDLEVTTDGEGHGSLRTPDLDYTIGVVLDPAEPSTAVWRREVTHVRRPDVAASEPFLAVFGSLFSTLVMEFAEPLDVAGLVDRLEDKGSPDVRVSCTSDGSACDVLFEGFTGTVHVEADRLEVRGQSPATAMALVERFFAFHERTPASADVPLLGE